MDPPTSGSEKGFNEVFSGIGQNIRAKIMYDTINIVDVDSGDGPVDLLLLRKAFTGSVAVALH